MTSSITDAVAALCRHGELELADALAAYFADPPAEEVERLCVAFAKVFCDTAGEINGNRRLELGVGAVLRAIAGEPR